MSFIATSIIVGAGAGYLGSRAIARGAERGAEAQVAGQREATNVQMEMFRQNRADMLPWIETGQEAQYTLADLMGVETGRDPSERFGTLAQPFTGEDLYQDPGYAFRKAEGEKAINRMASASGGFFGGRRGKALTEYGSDLASQEYGAAFARDRATRGDLYARLSGLSSGGRGGAQAVGTAGIQTGADVGRNVMASGRSLADMYATQGRATQSAYTDIANIGTAGMENYMYRDMMRNPQNYPGMNSGRSTGAWDR